MHAQHLRTKVCTPTCDSVFNLPLHLERVHVNGPVPNETRTGNSPVRLAESILMVVVSGKNRWSVSILQSSPMIFFLFLNPASGELAILSLGIYLNKLKTSVHTKSYVCILSHVWLFGTPWTIARQVPLSMGFPRQDYWSGLPFPTPGDLPNPRTEPISLVSPALAGEFLTTASSGKPTKTHTQTFIAA